MQNTIIRQLRIAFYISIACIVATFCLGELDVIPNGLYTSSDNQEMEYTYSVICTLLLLLSVPVTVQWVGKRLQSRPANMSDENALSLFRRYCLIRLAVWTIVSIFCVVTYFLTMSTTGTLCAAITLLFIVIYCWPTEKKVEDYLTVTDSEE